MNKPVFAIDPGNQFSAYCVYFPDTHTLGDSGKVTNAELREIIKERSAWDHRYAIEIPRLIGQQVWQQCVDTSVEAGRFIQIFHKHEWAQVYRKDVKLHLLGRANGNDSHVRQAIMAEFPTTGGGKNPVVGIKSQPGPLFGVSKDVWQALGVALTYHEKTKQRAAA